jgi:hypothetical protein
MVQFGNKLKENIKQQLLYGARKYLKRIREHLVETVILDLHLKASKDLADYMDINTDAEIKAFDESAHMTGIRTYIGLALRHGDRYASKRDQVDLNNYKHWIEAAERCAGEMEWDISSQLNKVRRFPERNVFNRKLLRMLYSKTGILQ